MQTQRFCPDCQAPIPPDAPEGLCPECLMKGALAIENVITVTAGPSDPSEPLHLPDPGSQFGDYRIERILGRGGMGAVYEAEQIETGRRIALKVLAHRLDSPDARARFFREGRLAASINHPNSVYVYGTGDVDDTPVIIMELVRGCTLQERVERDGPMAISEAVDAIIDVISGLQAAQAIGILHRDIKPANCFEDADGSVKVGDFGLSLSTEACDENELTREGLFLGTPAFCSPEQIRGDGLSVNSDIYSVGVTLFYLLTGRMPFEGKTSVQLLANVLEKAPHNPQDFRPEIPVELAEVILRCLEKLPNFRFGDYEELRHALAPFSPEALESATLAQRSLAGLIDGVLFWSLTTPVVFLLAFYSGLALEDLGQGEYAIVGNLIFILYFAFSEGRWGCSVGKAILGLKVISNDRRTPRFLKAGLRAAVFVVLPSLPSWIMHALGTVEHEENNPTVMAALLAGYLIWGLLWSTVRQRNGWAGLHDLASRTRVIHKARREIRPVLSVADRHSVGDLTYASRIGAYHVLENLAEGSCGKWMLAYDTRLLRKIWIHQVPAETPEIPVHLRGLERIGRLRWLGGRRSNRENWDAYEAPLGTSLLHLITTAQSWEFVRFWLFDLAEELAKAELDGTLPEILSVDRVWISSDGRAKLLDFPAPGLSPEELVLPCSSPSEFLKTVALSALEGREDIRTTAPVHAAIPEHARKLLEDPMQFSDPASAANSLKAVLHKPVQITRKRRVAMAVACLFFPLVIVCSMMLSMKVFLAESYARSTTVIGHTDSTGFQETLFSPVVFFLMLTYALLFLVALPAVFAAICPRGGLIMRVFGVCVVRKDGLTALRKQIIIRSLLTWAPLLLIGSMGMVQFLFSSWSSSMPTMSVVFIFLDLAALTAWSTMLPDRGLPDRIAGTMLVPR